LIAVAGWEISALPVMVFVAAAFARKKIEARHLFMVGAGVVALASYMAVLAFLSFLWVWCCIG